MVTNGCGFATISQRSGPLIVPGAKRLPGRPLKNSNRLAISGDCASMRDSSVEPQRPVPTMKRSMRGVVLVVVVVREGAGASVAVAQLHRATPTLDCAAALVCGHAARVRRQQRREVLDGRTRQDRLRDAIGEQVADADRAVAVPLGIDPVVHAGIL